MKKSEHISCAGSHCRVSPHPIVVHNRLTLPLCFWTMTTLQVETVSSTDGRTTPSLSTAGGRGTWPAPAGVGGEGGGGGGGGGGGTSKKTILLDDEAYVLVYRVFNGGLSHALVQTLTVIGERAPVLRREVQVKFCTLFTLDPHDNLLIMMTFFVFCFRSPPLGW